MIAKHFFYEIKALRAGKNCEKELKENYEKTKKKNRFIRSIDPDYGIVSVGSSSGMDYRLYKR